MNYPSYTGEIIKIHGRGEVLITEMGDENLLRGQMILVNGKERVVRDVESRVGLDGRRDKNVGIVLY